MHTHSRQFEGVAPLSDDTQVVDPTTVSAALVLPPLDDERWDMDDRIEVVLEAGYRRVVEARGSSIIAPDAPRQNETQAERGGQPPRGFRRSIIG